MKAILAYVEDGLRWDQMLAKRRRENVASIRGVAEQNAMRKRDVSMTGSL